MGRRIGTGDEQVMATTEHDLTYRHEAALYAGEAGFVAAAVPFVRDALAAGEPVMVMVAGSRIGLLRDAIGADAAAVHFADMAVVGANPARIIPAWREFVAEQGAGGRPLRGIGEPIWSGRSPAELVEAQRHESLLNVAIPDTTPMWLLCPYDTEALPAEVIAEAGCSHPLVTEGGERRRSAAYRGPDASAAPFDAPLPEAAGDAAALAFEATSLVGLRSLVARQAGGADLDAGRTADLVQAVNEVATNSLRHGGGQGRLRVWREAGALVCEVSDAGRLEQPLAGRERPGADPHGRCGLWLANQVCDLVQVRTFETGTVVRLRVECR
jgi:anti-sigma regulatory factor (Ser/Thr protein kinase)